MLYLPSFHETHMPFAVGIRGFLRLLGCESGLIFVRDQLPAPSREGELSSSVQKHRSLVKRKVATPVLLPARFVVLHTEGFFLAPTGGYKLIRGNAETDEILLYSIGAAVAESDVVLGRTALIAVAFDGDVSRRVALEEIRRLLKGLACIRTNGR